MALISCKECGKQISESATQCPYCGAPVVKDVFCSKCGTKVPETVEFCPNCGTPISAPRSLRPGEKDKTVAGLFALLLGGLGIQYFYLGKITAGILSIVLSAFSCGIWTIVTLIQGILMLTMSDAEFEQKYVKTEKTFPLF